MTTIQKLTRAADRCYICAEKRKVSDPALAKELVEDGAAIRKAIGMMTKHGIPTEEDVMKYAEEIALPLSEARKFIDHFSSNGWKVGGKAVMKDWKAALRNWRRGWEERNPKPLAAQRSGDPDCWREWIIMVKRLPYQSYATARVYLKEEFAKRK